MKALTIFYDPQCGLCTQFRVWLEKQPKRVRVEFLDFRSEAAAARMPGLAALHPELEVVVLADDGRWWQGSGAWITCLWTALGYRPWAYRLASPALQPLVKKVVHLISSHRLGLSGMLQLGTDEKLAKALAAVPEPACESGSCNL